MALSFQFLCALFIIGFEYWSGYGLDVMAPGHFFRLLVAGLGVTLCISLYLKFRSIKHAPHPMPLRNWFTRFLSPLLLVVWYALIAANLALHDPKTDISSELLVLLAGMLLAQAIGIWKEWMWQQRKANDISQRIIIALVAALVLASLFHPDWSSKNQLYEYRGVLRWTGPVKDPNHFGLLMALGMVLAIALLPLLFPLQKSPMAESVLFDETKATRTKPAWTPRIFLFLSIVLLLFALVKSYSRGAWLSAFVGVGYLIFSWKRNWAGYNNQESVSISRVLPGWTPKWWPGCSQFALKNAVSFSLIAVSLLVISFYCFRHSEVRIVRRVFSPGNVYDFSWRNRMVAYNGALQIMADNPWSGLGWGQQEVYYSEYYRPSRLTEGYAILLNDYFTLGMILGLPALGCFVGYVWLALGKEGTSPAISKLSMPEVPEDNRTRAQAGRSAWLRTAAKAGAIVLLIGFWFDHGLLMVPIGLPFWLLLELAREEYAAFQAESPLPSTMGSFITTKSSA